MSAIRHRRKGVPCAGVTQRGTGAETDHLSCGSARVKFLAIRLPGTGLHWPPSTGNPEMTQVFHQSCLDHVSGTACRAVPWVLAFGLIFGPPTARAQPSG